MVASSSQVAIAQETGPNESVESIDEIRVTGSRIARRAGFDTLQPAVQVDSAFMDDRGSISVGDALGEQPAFGLGTSGSGNQAINSIGQNFLNIFGLGQARTLTLINGRRVVSAVSPTVQETQGEPGLAVDMNMIPSALIDRVETIFIGGAPAYGTDAIAGTVNVILKDDFEGFSSEAQYGLTGNGDAESYRLRGLWGGNFANGRGNATVAIEYTSVQGLLASDNKVGRRDSTFCENPANTGPDDGISDFELCEDGFNFYIHLNTAQPAIGGDATDRDRRLRIDPFNNYENALKDADGNPLAFDVDGSLRTWGELGLGTPRNAVYSQGGNAVTNPTMMSVASTNAIINPVDRFIASTSAHYQLTDNIRVFGEALFSRTEAEQLISVPRAMADLSGPSQLRPAIPINIGENPYVSQQLIDTLIMNDAYDPNLVDGNGDPVPQYFRISRSNLDVEGDAGFERDQDIFRYVAGLEGEFDAMGRSWRWDTAFIYGKTSSVIYSPNIDAERYSYAMDAVTDPETGQPVCRVQLEGFDDPSLLPLHRTAISECVPFNPLGFNPLTDEQRAYLIQDSISTSHNEQMIFEANIAGELGYLPAGPIGIAGGITHRREEAEFRQDRSALNALSESGARFNVAGEFNTTELYAETLLPLVRDGEGIAFLDSVFTNFDVEGALRYVDNSMAGSDVTWTAGGRMGLNVPGIRDSVVFRGNFTRAIRAPAITELFLPRQDIRTTANDPCDPRFLLAGPNPNQRRANCQAQAGNLDLDNFVSDIVTLRQEAIAGGNPQLQSEKSNSWTIGAVITPESVPGFSLSVDWMSIDISNAIVQLGADQILNACYDSADTSTAAACAVFSRDANFQVVGLETGYVNAAERLFKGLVANVSYSFPASSLPFGDMSGHFEAFGNLLYTAKHQQRVGGGDLDLLVGERYFERLNLQMNLRYTTGSFMALWQTQRHGSFAFNRQETEEYRPEDQSKVGAMYIHNITFGYRLTENVGARLVVNNIFDNRDSPLRAAGAVDQNFMDPLGRRFLMALSVDF